MKNKFLSWDFESACLRHAELYLLMYPTQKEGAPIRSRTLFMRGY